MCYRIGTTLNSGSPQVIKMNETGNLEALMTNEEWSMLKAIINNHDDRLRALEAARPLRQIMR